MAAGYPPVEHALDVFTREPSARVVSVSIHRAPAVAVGNNVVVHHRDNESAKVEFARCEFIGQRIEGGHGGASAGASEQERFSRVESRLDAVGDRAGERASERGVVCEDVDSSCEVGHEVTFPYSLTAPATTPVMKRRWKMM